MSDKPSTPFKDVRSFRLGLFWKILLAAFITGLLPLLLIAYRSVAAIQDTGQTAQDVAAQELDNKSIEALQVRAQQAATQITELLTNVVEDTQYLTHLQPDATLYLEFYHSRSSQIWFQTGTPEAATQLIKQTPLYRELAYIDASGMEVLRIRNGAILPPQELRNVSDPANTTYLTETYFADTAAIASGEVWVTPVMAWYVTVEAQTARALDAETSRFEYPKYEAVIRFASPIRDATGALQGIVVLSLDHRHVMEIANHIQSISGSVVWPDLASGNYAYLLDYEGWLISHADMTTLRGLDAEGNLMPTQTNATVEAGDILPFNMLTSDRKPAAIEIATAVLSGNSDYLRSTNRQGTLKVDIYVPILFDHGVYAANGYFGGLVLSENVLNVEKAGEISRGIIEQAVQKVLWDISWIIGVSIILLLSGAIFLSRNINQPISKLTDAARDMEKGELDVDTLNALLERKPEDEVNDLSRVFKQMAQAVQMRERRLREEVQLLRIQIDETRKKEDVDKIVQSEVFKNLQEKAQLMRARRQSKGT